MMNLVKETGLHTLKVGVAVAEYVAIVSVMQAAKNKFHEKKSKKEA